jgi:hypothetical protein
MRQIRPSTISMPPDYSLERAMIGLETVLQKRARFRI